ncbi:SDR family oxidoreductase [Streptomyces sp. NPDC004629]|uniref:SDR family oxidoreductase n=1 Tax=Streptomyces sp. NPDC004629 TaxID=3364705 RepID=UPI0036BB51B0
MTSGRPARDGAAAARRPGPAGPADAPGANNQAFAAATPMRRGARPEEVSYGVLFLASDEAGYITGTDLFIDGGYTAQ